MNGKFAEVIKNLINCAVLMIVAGGALFFLGKKTIAIGAIALSVGFVIAALIIYFKTRNDGDEE